MARIHRRTAHTKSIHEPDNQNVAITHLEPDVLKCEVKESLWSIVMNKACRIDGILFQLFHSCGSASFNMPPNLENSSGHRNGKVHPIP